MKSKYKPLKKSRSNKATSKKPPSKIKAVVSRKKKPKASKPRKIKSFNYKLEVLKPMSSPTPLPDTNLTKKGKTLRQLMRNTVALYRHNSIDVVVKSIKETKTKSGLPAISAVMLTVDGIGVLRPRECVVIGLDYDQPIINKQKRILVSCNCPSYVFTFEYSNAAHGAGRIIYCNGKPPTINNSGLAPGLCKHLYALGEHIVKSNI